jgi:hypothetical protein
LAINLLMLLAALLSWRWLWRGRIEHAGNILVLAAVLPVHGLLLLVSDYAQPLASAIQLFVFGFTFLLLAVTFASQRVAVVTLLVVVTGQVSMRFKAFGADTAISSWDFAADTLLRDGLLGIGLVFSLG